jgi:hypothetical protein
MFENFRQNAKIKWILFVAILSGVGITLGLHAANEAIAGGGRN